ncbi:H-NS family nucleoid-associated regulatory protein [Roseovarius sp. M141]|uniref:H-NS histone family protein n=1 Tax=Roseovarius sp. M141 TaxID=2583806 RepID=UPI0020CD1FD6|nr:H-NS histone family protein [Roseovarius sp. M141]MCQ0093810.1 H-NS histone family protein [Roseovarius sp. M141]
MAKFDLKSLSVQELKSLQKKVDRELAGRDKRQRKEALNAVKEKAKQLGFSLGDLIGDGAGPNADGTSGSPKAVRAPAPVKYRSLYDPQLTWSGRGRPPRWIKEAQENGVDLETLRVDPEA